jgi:hypothetical protein
MAEETCESQKKMYFIALFPTKFSSLNGFYGCFLALCLWDIQFESWPANLLLCFKIFVILLSFSGKFLEMRTSTTRGFLFEGGGH